MGQRQLGCPQCPVIKYIRILLHLHMCVHEFVMSRLLHFYLEITDDGWLVNVIGKYIFFAAYLPFIEYFFCYNLQEL